MFLISELVIPARRHRGNWLRFFQDLWEGKPIAWTVVGVIALIIAAVLVIKFRYGGTVQLTFGDSAPRREGRRRRRSNLPPPDA